MSDLKKNTLFSSWIGALVNPSSPRTKKNAPPRILEIPLAMKKLLFPVLALLALSASPAAAQNSTTMDFTFSVPGHVAKKGVFVSLFGQFAGSNTTGNSAYPWVFAWNSPNAAFYSTGSTQTSAYTPVSTTASYQGTSTFSTANSTQIYIPTGATALFPSPIGNLTLTDGTTTLNATYNGTTNNAGNGNPDWFNNVVWSGPGGNYTANWTVYSPDGPVSSGTSVFAPTTNVIFVDSIADFPSSGNLTLVSGTVSLLATYNGTAAGNSSSTPPVTPSFTGVQFINASQGFAPGYTVSPGNILGSTIGLNSTAGLPSSGLLMLQTPASVTAKKNVVVSYSGISGNSVTGVAPFPAGGNFTETLPGGGPAFPMPAGNITVEYAQLDGIQGLNVPMVSLFPYGASFDDHLTYNATLAMPDYSTNGILSGVAVMSVGTAAALPIPATGTPTVGSPTPGTIPNDIFGIFEWGLVNSSSGLDFDVSEVDQVGFPFRTSTQGTQPPVPADPVLGVGMLQDRDTLFAGFTSFLNGLPATSNATAFLQGSADNSAAPFPVNTRITAPQDIIGILQGQAPVMGAALPVALGNLTVNSTTTAYYAVTATSADGESMVSNVTSGANGASTPGLQVSWSPYPYATGYNLYWSALAGLPNPILIASTTGNGNTTYTDSTPWSHSAAAATPPLNNYGYDPLNRYLTPVIKDFFDYYSPSHGNHTFALDDQATQTLWTGQVGTVNMLGHTYRMLQLTGGSGQWGNQFSGKTLNILEPFFSSNTDNSSNPPPPIISTGDDVTTLDPYQQAYIQNGTLVLTQNGNVWSYSGSGAKNAQGSYTAAGTGYTANMTLKVYESASAMVFGADGVFGTFVGNGSTLDIGDAKNVYNNIASALNRGITPRNISGNWTNTIPPNYWASDYLVLKTANATTGGNLTAGSYRYWITAYGILGDKSTQETPPCNVLPISLTQGNQSVLLGWNAVNGPGGPIGAATVEGFNIYRSQQVSGNWTTPGLIGTVSNNSTTPTTSFTDTGGNATTAPPNQWYQPGTLSNFYAAYFTQYDVSINGLSYGFAYGDKGGLSTNVQMSPYEVTAVVITLNPWTAPAGLPTIEVNGVLNPFSTTNGTASAQQAFTASGSSLLDSITVTAPAGFELSTTGDGSFSSNLTLAPTSGSVPLTSIYARIGATEALGILSGNISLSSTNANTQNVAVTGNVTSGAETPYQQWLAAYPSLTGNATEGSADPDGDGYVNDTEFAFDGNPTVPTASLLTTSTSGGNMTVSFIARNTTPAGASYQVQETTNLNLGFEPSAVLVSVSDDQSGILLPDQYQRRQFTVPTTGSKKFYRIQATLD